MDETTFISKCCREEAFEDFKENPYDDPQANEVNPIEIWVCSKCKKECEVEEVCAYCLGDGEYSTDESDGEGHIMRGVGTQKCHCTIEDDYDDQDL